MGEEIRGGIAVDDKRKGVLQWINGWIVGQMWLSLFFKEKVEIHNDDRVVIKVWWWLWRRQLSK